MALAAIPAMAYDSPFPTTEGQLQIPVFEKVTFYDGYRVADFPDDRLDEPYYMPYTSLATTPLTDEILDKIGERLSMNVAIYAACDNYDRIGGVNLALVPKGQESYTVKFDETDPIRIEIARFITPFMNKNKEPFFCPYHFDIDNVSALLRDADLRANYDFWLELQVFGVPYAAWEQVKGCEEGTECRNQVFKGTLELVTDAETSGSAPLIETNRMVRITNRTADWRADHGVNNYNEACTDEVGTTSKTWTFTVPDDVKDGYLFLISSNHGANSGGEEYVRRWHYISFDGETVHEYRPGRNSCEPFRQYNTQANGIYGYTPKTDAKWQTFSNWCPGDVIDIRVIPLGSVTAGEHSVNFNVPTAKFKDGQGYFPVSIYFQGDTENELPVSAIEALVDDPAGDDLVSYEICDETISLSSEAGIALVELYAMDGGLQRYTTGNTLSTSGLAHGVYVMAVRLANGVTEAHKIIL